jgi:hypothetical protein
LVYADDVHLLSDSLNTIKENKETLLEASREQNQNIRIVNESFENVAKFK